VKVRSSSSSLGVGGSENNEHRTPNTEQLNTNDQIPDAIFTIPDDFQGFVPVIINIMPVTDFMGLLGLKNIDRSQEIKEPLLTHS